MDRILGMVLFLSLFTLIYGLMHFYVFMRLSILFSVPRNAALYALMAFLALSYFLAEWARNSISTGFGRVLYLLAAVWMGAIFLLFFLVLARDALGLVVPLPHLLSGLAVVCLAVLIGSYSVINASSVGVRSIDIHSSKIAIPVRLVQLSDLHIGAIHGENYLGKVVAKVNELKPDAVVITGDLLEGEKRYGSDEFKILDTVGAKMFFVTGNHEMYAGIDQTRKILDGLSVDFLSNREESMLLNSNKFTFVGVDYSDDNTVLGKVVDKLSLDTASYNILLYHRPSGFRYARERGFDLMLAGHTHRGQIFPFNLLVWIFERPVYGLSKMDGGYVYVSSGTGTWGPPMRLGSRNEIVLINILPEN
jgi:uncharacterized protein